MVLVDRFLRIFTELFRLALRLKGKKMVALVAPPRNTLHRPDLEPRLAVAHRRIREAQRDAAAVLAQVRDSGHHRAVGCASMYEFGERR